MTASASTRPGSAGASLAEGASPATIRAALLPEDRDAFDQSYWEASERAKREYDVTPVHSTLENWRRQAIAQSDRDGFRRMVRRAAEFFTGEPVPDDEPFDVTRRRAGM